jgi:PAS domain S-box-containing protein
MNESLAARRAQVDEDFRTLVELAPDALFVGARDGLVLYANRAACALCGQSSAELQGRPFGDLLPLQSLQQADAQATASGSPDAPAIATHLQRADGSWLPVEVRASLLSDGRLQAWVRVVPAPEGAPGPHERLLQTVFELLPVGVWIADRNGRIVDHNPAAERIWSGARHVDIPEYDQYQGWSLATGQRLAPEDWALARAVTRGETTTGELVRIRGFDGSFKTIINSAAPLRGDDDEITGAIVVNEDITRLHEAQEQQRASEDLLRTVFNLLPVGLWIANRDGRITLANPAAEHIWGGADAAAKSVAYEAWSVETNEPITDDEWALARALRGETSHSELIRIRCFDGSTRTIMNWAAPLRSATGEIIGAVGADEDVTSLQYTQEQLRSAVRERERILAVVAHDLRNPLSALMAHAAVVQLAAGRLPGGEKLAHQAGAIVDIGKRMAGLVNDLLSVSAAGAGGHHMLSLSLVKPAEVLERAVDAVRPLMAARNLALEILAAGDLPPVRADADRILRVLGNLLDNALKFTAAPGRIVVAARSTTTGILLSVANTGPAVPAGEMETMFQPFWQAQNDRAGTGLGLAICRSIVEAHGGTIWAEPAEGQRLRVCFVLPRT